MENEKLLRSWIRETLRAESGGVSQDLKNVGSRHEKTVGGTAALRRMHDAPGVLPALSQLHDPKELAQVIQALIDAVPITSRGDVFRALGIVGRHERATHRR